MVTGSTFRLTFYTCQKVKACMYCFVPLARACVECCFVCYWFCLLFFFFCFVFFVFLSFLFVLLSCFHGFSSWKELPHCLLLLFSIEHGCCCSVFACSAVTFDNVASSTKASLRVSQHTPVETLQPPSFLSVHRGSLQRGSSSTVGVPSRKQVVRWQVDSLSSYGSWRRNHRLEGLSGWDSRPQL